MAKRKPRTTTITKPSSTPPPEVPISSDDKALILLEAEWVSRDMQESIKLVQQYRGVYVTAVFLAFAWLLGQLIPESDTATGVSQQSLEIVQQQLDLISLRTRIDIALLLVGIAVISVLFTALIIEAYVNWRSLARYRIELGRQLGSGVPIWRYEFWKATTEGSTRAWTSTLNVLYFVFTIMLVSTILWFTIPALLLGSILGLKVIWIATVVLFVGTYVRMLHHGLRKWDIRSMTRASPISWHDLK
jgi:hypothetical protein